MLRRVAASLGSAAATALKQAHAAEATALPTTARAFAAQPAAQPDLNPSANNVADITVSRVMREKAESGAPTAGLFTVKTHDYVFEAVKKMAEANVGSVIVMKGETMEAENVAGIITERDYVRKVAVEGKSSKEMKCSALMTGTRELTTITPQDNIFKAMQLMEEKNIRHIPVFDESELLGILSIKDIISTLMNERESELASMSEYINVSY